MVNETVKIGIIVGAGTGGQLANIFKDFLSRLVAKYTDKSVEFLDDLDENEHPFVYHSYQSLVTATGNDTSQFNKISRSEVARLVNLTKKWHKSGVKTIFRTSINAEALYLFRQKVKAVKIFGLETVSGSRILFVRDQTEGFYANTVFNLSKDLNEIYFSGKFTKEHQQRVMRYAINEANIFMQEQPFEKWAIYKYHLFGNILEKWLLEVDNAIIANQPDNGLTELNSILSKERRAESTKRNILLVCSNEVGDIVYETILGILNIEVKLELYSRNLYMSRFFRGGMLEYQTVHGSADDIAGTENVLPNATLRIAADIAEKDFGIGGAKDLLEYAIGETKRKKLNETSPILAEIYHQFQLTLPTDE